MNFANTYDKKYLVKCVLGLAAMAVFLYVTKGNGFAVAPLVMFSAFVKNRSESLLYLLLMTIAMTMGNSNLMPKSTTFMITQRAMMFTLSAVMLVQIFGRANAPLAKPFLWLLLYLGFMVLSSTMGWCPILSYMKLSLFFAVYMAYYGIANRVMTSPNPNVPRIRSVFLSFAIFFLVGSILLIPFPGISQMHQEEIQEALKHGKVFTSLYMGMTVHSQSLGPICAVLGILLYVDMVFSIRRADRLYMALLACVPILIWKTASRTAMGAFIIGIALATCFVMRARGIGVRWRGKVLSTLISGVVLFSLVVLALPVGRQKVTDFVLKFNREEKRAVTMEEVTMTRRAAWENAMYNFKRSPMIGNGFQVSSQFAGLKITNPFQVLSAPVEKGTWVTAVLEEGGIWGMALFLIFLGVVVRFLLSRHAYMGASAFITMVVLNLGEFTMFSMTAVGGLLWAMVFVGVIFDSQRIRAEAFQSMPPPLPYPPPNWR